MAISLNGELAEPYMYRGVLYVQMGNVDMAKKDHAALKKLESPLAAELEWVIVKGKEKEPDQLFGVVKTMK